MLFNKWLICPVISGLLFAGSAIAQTQWIEIGRTQDGDLVRLNRDLKVEGSTGSVVMYQILVDLNPPVDGFYQLKIDMIAQCQSKSHAISSTEGLDQQGRVVKSYTVSNADIDWQTPQSDAYGKAFQLACSSR